MRLAKPIEPGSNGEQPIDGFSLLVQYSGDVAFVRTLLRRFTETADGLLSELDRAITMGDTDAARVAACSLRGAALALHAAPLVAAVSAVEASVAGGIPTVLPLAAARSAVERCLRYVPLLISDLDGGRVAIVA